MNSGNTGVRDESQLIVQRACVAELMDAHPDLFREPVHGGHASWSSMIQAGQVPEKTDALVLEKALNMLSAFYNKVQGAITDAFPLAQAMREDAEGFAQFEPDDAALALASEAYGKDNEDAIAFARSIAIYKTFQESGEASGDELLDHLHGVIDSVPGHGALLEDMKSATKKLATLQFAALVKA